MAAVMRKAPGGSRRSNRDPPLTNHRDRSTRHRVASFLVGRILGLRVDLADIERIGRILEKYPRFAERCFTEHEREYAFRVANPEKRLAARFAGKEAVYGIPVVGPPVMGVVRGFLGSRWQRTRRAEMLGVTEVLVTITHTPTLMPLSWPSP